MTHLEQVFFYTQKEREKRKQLRCIPEFIGKNSALSFLWEKREFSDVLQMLPWWQEDCQYLQRRATPPPPNKTPRRVQSGPPARVQPHTLILRANAFINETFCRYGVCCSIASSLPPADRGFVWMLYNELTTKLSLSSLSLLNNRLSLWLTTFFHTHSLPCLYI